jgi:hypothetical protein
MRRLSTISPREPSTCSFFHCHIWSYHYIRYSDLIAGMPGGWYLLTQSFEPFIKKRNRAQRPMTSADEARIPPFQDKRRVQQPTPGAFSEAGIPPSSSFTPRTGTTTHFELDALEGMSSSSSTPQQLAVAACWGERNLVVQAMQLAKSRRSLNCLRFPMIVVKHNE